MFQDPLSLVPYAIAAGGGYLEDVAAARLVTAGLTLLQRSAPLVRSLSGKPAAMLVPDGLRTLIALAASEGRTIHLLPAEATTEALASLMTQYDIGAIFTTHAFDSQLPEAVTAVFLDEAPWNAEVRSDAQIRRVDLGTHHGLALVGDTATPGRDEPFVVVEGTPLTHAEVLHAARDAVARYGLTPAHCSQPLRPFWTRDGLILSLIAPLLAGGRVTI